MIFKFVKLTIFTFQGCFYYAKKIVLKKMGIAFDRNFFSYLIADNDHYDYFSEDDRLFS